MDRHIKSRELRSGTQDIIRYRKDSQVTENTALPGTRFAEVYVRYGPFFIGLTGRNMMDIQVINTFRGGRATPFSIVGPRLELRLIHKLL